MSQENSSNKQPLIRYVNRQQISWRAVENTAILAFREKMASQAAQAQYRRRSQVAEFCHAWIKSKLGLRQFHVRGLVKVQMEMLWACFTYNLQHWIRLSKIPATPAAA